MLTLRFTYSLQLLSHHRMFQSKNANGWTCHVALNGMQIRPDYFEILLAHAATPSRRLKTRLSCCLVQLPPLADGTPDCVSCAAICYSVSTDAFKLRSIGSNLFA